MEHITIGKIIKAQGIKGEIKIKPMTDDVARFKKLKVIYINELPYQITACRFNGDFAYLYLLNIDDRNKAELLVNKDITIEKVNSVALPADRYFITDIEGCEIFSEENQLIGKIIDIMQSGAADVFTIKTFDNKIVRIPFIKALKAQVDIDNKIVIVDAKIFNEVCVYED